MFFFLLIALVSSQITPADKVSPESGPLQEKYEKGLITINPEKSVYSAGEEAVIYMVVLDEEGKPVSGADVELSLTMPDSSSAPLTVGSAGDDGVYIVTYTIPVPGTYRPKALASFKSSSVRGETSFVAEDAPKFEIIRSAPLKIDPRLGPFSSSIKAISREEGPVTLVETVPMEFNISDSGGASISVSNDRKILRWTGLENNSTVTYSVKAPLLWPYLFELGPAKIEYGSFAYTEPRTWQLASDPGTIIQPSSNDSYMEQNRASNNYGADTVIKVASDLKGGTPKNIRSLVRFNLSSIPAGAVVESATLQLYVDKSPNQESTYGAHRLTSGWVESEVTWNSNATGSSWNNAGGDFVSTATNMTTVTTTAAVWVSWNITNDVRGWHNGTYPNFGTLVKDFAENSTAGKNETKFASMDYGTAEFRPRLLVNYSDINPPRWRNQSQSKDVLNIGEEVILRAQGWDDWNLSYAWLETNETGTPVNKTGVYGSPMYLGTYQTWTWSNFTWSNSSLGGGTGVTWRIWYNDTYGNVNKTDYRNFTIQYQDTPPQWRNVGQNTSTPAVREDVKLYAQGYDETSLEFAWLETNETGTFRNYTGAYGGVYGSPMYMGGAITWTWSNFTWRNDSLSAGDTVRWRIWYNDSSGQVNVTSYQQFTLQTPGTTLQPSEKDSYLDEENPDTNYGTNVELMVRSRGGGRNKRSLAQFDLSSLPSGISIGSAVLQLYVTNQIPGVTRTYNVHRLTNSWVESEVTWNTRLGSTTWNASGGDFIGTATASANAGTTTYTWVSWNITEDVRGWYNGTYSNYGALIKDSVESAGNNEIRFVSKDNSTDTSLRPRLMINYSYLPDLNPPQWRNQNQSTATPNVGDEVILSAQGKDDVALQYAWLATNETGAWQNKSGLYGSPKYLGELTNTWVWSNFTWSNNSLSDGAHVGWRIWYNDTGGSVNKTDIMAFTIQAVPGPPKWRYQNQSDNEPYEGSIVTLSAQGYDESSLRYAWLETNESGVFENKSGVYGSPMYMGGGAGWVWSNFTWKNSSVKNGTTVAWRIWYNDSLSNVNVTNYMSFLVTEARIVIQPSNTDSYIREDQVNNNFGSATELRVRSRSGNRNWRSLVQFDLSSIPPGLRIDSAELQLYTTQVPGSLRTYDVHRINQSWTESGVTWNSRDGSNNWLSPGGNFTPTVTNYTQAGLVNNVWVSWNITEDVRGWYNGTYSNYGTLIKDSSESSAVNYEIRFASKEYTPTTYRPRLVIRFTPDTTPPQWRSQGWNASSSNLTQINRTVNLSAQGFDNLALSYAWLATNETGTWENKSGTYGSPLLMNIGGQWAWSNFTWRNLNLPIGTHVGWRIWYNDTAGNLNGTSILAFTLVSWKSYCDANFQTPCDDFQNFSSVSVYFAGYGYPPNTDFDIAFFYPDNTPLDFQSPIRSNASGWLNATLPKDGTEPVGTSYKAVVYPLNKAPIFLDYDPTDPEIIAVDTFNLIQGVPEFGYLAIPIAASGAIYLWMRRRLKTDGQN